MLELLGFALSRFMLCCEEAQEGLHCYGMKSAKEDFKYQGESEQMDLAFLNSSPLL